MNRNIILAILVGILRMDRKNLIGLSHYQNKNGVLLIEVPTLHKANEIAFEILQKYSDSKTALFLSGGNTPKKLYEEISDKKTLKAGAVLQIDERYGEKLHKNSNELMIKNSGILDYFESENVRFYPILENSTNDRNQSLYNILTYYTPVKGQREEKKSLSIEQVSRDYDEALRFIFKYFPKSVGVLGIGADGHTAGIPAELKTQNSKLKSSKEIVRKMIEDQSSYVSFYELEGYGPRITLNFNALSMLDLILILVLGQEKRDVLSSMFKSSDNLDEEILKFPAKFYLKPKIAEKTIIITDQII